MAIGFSSKLVLEFDTTTREEAHEVYEAVVEATRKLHKASIIQTQHSITDNREAQIAKRRSA